MLRVDAGATTSRRLRAPAGEEENTIILIRSVQSDGHLPGLEHEFTANSAINPPHTCGICPQVGMPLQDDQEKEHLESRIQERLAALNKASGTQEGDDEDNQD